MIVLNNGDKVQGNTTTASKVDYSLYGLKNNVLTQLANGQLPNSIGDLYTAASADVVSVIVLVNTNTTTESVNLYMLPSGGTARRLIAMNLQLQAGYSLHFDGKSVTVLTAAGGVVYGSGVDDTAYGVSWDGVTTVAPSKNAVYDQMQLQMLKTGSNLAIGSDADGDMYYRSGGVLARLAKGTANLKLFMNAGATAPEWASGSLMITGSFDLSLTTDLSIGSFGFVPSVLFIYASPGGSSSLGMACGANYVAMPTYFTGSYYATDPQLIYCLKICITDNTKAQQWTVKTWASTVVFARSNVGSPTGTCYYGILALR